MIDNFQENQKTKFKIAFALKDLIKKQPLEKITVVDIVTACGITRQTFYRHFEDKYELVNWYFEVLVHDSFVMMNKNKQLQLALENKFEFIQNELSFFKAAFKTEAYYSLVEFDFRYIVKFYSEIISKKTGCELSAEMKFALELYCRGSIYQTVVWVNNEQRVSPSEIAELLVSSLPPILKDLIVTFD